MNTSKLITKKGIIDAKILKHKTGIYYRENSCDLLSIAECNKNYKDVMVKDRTVLDLGANIGGFSYMAIKGGARKVVSLEPEKFNFIMLKQNLKDFENSILINSAISDKTESTLNFYIGKGKGGPSMASLKETRGRVKQTVQNIHAPVLFNKLKPDTIKIDIEGGEYDLIKHIPNSCTELTLEWHCLGLKNKTLFKEWYNYLINQSWKIVYERKKEFYVKDFYRKGLDKLKRTGGIPDFVIDAHYRR